MISIVANFSEKLPVLFFFLLLSVSTTNLSCLLATTFSSLRFLFNFTSLQSFESGQRGFLFSHFRVLSSILSLSFLCSAVSEALFTLSFSFLSKRVSFSSMINISSNFLKWKSGTGHTHQLTITHIPMNIIKSRKQGEKPEQVEVKKKTEKISTLECKSGSGCLAGSWLSINLLLSQLCQLDCLVPVQITMFTTRLFMSQTELPGQQ